MFNAVLTCAFSTSNEVHKIYMYPRCTVSLMSVSFRAFCLAYSMLQKLGLAQIQALSETMSAELAIIGVSCVLNWHVLSEER